MDSNVVVYLVSHQDTDKQTQARNLFRHWDQVGSIVLSTQVIQESYVILVKKLGIDPIEAKSILRKLALQYENVEVDIPKIMHAIDISILHRISFWDGLIISTAQSASCTKLYTEDLNHGQKINGVEVINPFSTP